MTCHLSFLPARSSAGANRLLNRHAGPYVTGVGGTTCSYPEVAADISQGGFSLIFAPERYQVDAMGPFLRQVRSDYSEFYKYARCFNLTKLLLH